MLFHMKFIHTELWGCYDFAFLTLTFGFLLDKWPITTMIVLLFSFMKFIKQNANSHKWVDRKYNERFAILRYFVHNPSSRMYLLVILF